MLKFSIYAESKKDSNNEQLKENQTKLQKADEENKSFIQKIKQLEEKLNNQESMVSSIPPWNARHSHIHLL